MHDTENTSDTGSQVVRPIPAATLTVPRISQRIMRDPGLSPNAKTLYVLIASYCPFDDQRSRVAFPGQETLAEQMGGLSVDTAQRAMRELENAGILTVNRRGQGKPNLYVLRDQELSAYWAAQESAASPRDAGSRTRAVSEKSEAAPVRSLDTAPMRYELDTGELDTELLSASPAPKRRAPAKPIPDTWEPNPAHKERAQQTGANLTVEAEQFRNHAQSVGRRCVDWDAAFRNWLLKARPAPTTTGNHRGRVPNRWAAPVPPDHPDYWRYNPTIDRGWLNNPDLPHNQPDAVWVDYATGA